MMICAFVQIGAIPVEMGQMTSLVGLALDGNEISGEALANRSRDFKVVKCLRMLL